MKKEFEAPDKQYGSPPLWVWNSIITKGEIDFMLADFKDKAFDGVFAYPGPGQW